ncbi:MAG: energy-coupled thiamine transporter ThiT [Clostridia bacterium]|nr:energy-coupled thiamine transporter ThiT [Clostridia bacterium]
MKKLLALLVALVLCATLFTCALAETADAAATETVETAAEETAEAVEETAEAAEEAAEETAEAAEEAAEEAVEEAEAPAGNEVSPIIKNLVELPWYTWVILALLLVTGVIFAAGSKKTTWNSRRIAMGAMCIAIAFVLSCIRLFRMPQGGSITPASMLPLVLFMVACGPLQGFVVGCAYGLLQLITDPYVIHPVQMLLDYPLASGAMILCCLVAVLPISKRWKLPIAVLLAGIGNYIMAVLSGSIFFAEYAGEQNAWIYSLTYNISYLGPNVLVCMLVACIPGMDRIVDMIAKK